MIEMPFPPAILAGHAKGNGQWAKIKATKEWRQKAHDAAWDADIAVPEEGDIGLHIHFIPGNRRGDRVNFWNRCKPLIDGIADALQINDSRFVPSMSFGEPKKPGMVVINIQQTLERQPVFPANRAVFGVPPEDQVAV